ncbi:hypothetical protein chiPu_0033045, partial [Chiloscyllium punctatum]|nr:hypothetical protein [Chiloscyllium punctatum]
HAGLVLHDHGQRVGLVGIVTLFEEVGGCGLVHGRPLTFFSRHRPLGGRRSIRPDPGPEQIEIDIAAAQDQADPLAGELALLLQRGCERRGACALGKIVGIGPVGADRLGDLVVGDLHDARCALPDQRERIRVRNPRRHAVSQRVAGRGGHDPSGRKRQRVGRRLG